MRQEITMTIETGIPTDAKEITDAVAKLNVTVTSVTVGEPTHIDPGEP